MTQGSRWVLGLFVLLTGCFELEVDIITFGTDASEPGDPGKSDVRFTLDAKNDVRLISPYIYGFNDNISVIGNNTAALHFGTNRISAYNWENNASNSGSEFGNVNDAAYCVFPDNPPAAPIEEYLIYDVDLIAIAIPINDYVAADYDIGGDVTSSPDYLHTRFKENRPTKDAAFSLEPDLTDDFVYQDELVNWVKARAGDKHVMFSLDDDVDKWDEIHPAIRPKGKLTFDELIERNNDYAEAIKETWPEADVGGFVGKTWLGLATLNMDITREDPLIVERYVQTMREKSTAYGRRLIDYLEVRFFPQVYFDSDVNNPEMNAEVRMQSPRELWDETYTDTLDAETKAWLGDDVGLAYISRLKKVIAENDPELKLLISSWGFGGDNHISGAIALADTLGIFGRDGVDAAMNFDMFISDETARQYLYAGFRMFRNFDGNMSCFGNISFRAVTDDVDQTSVYASYDADDPDRVVIVAINKAASSLTAGITIAHDTIFTRLSVYVLDDTGADIVAGQAVGAVDRNAFRYEMPPRSVSVLLPAK